MYSNALFIYLLLNFKETNKQTIIRKGVVSSCFQLTEAVLAVSCVTARNNRLMPILFSRHLFQELVFVVFIK
jgi:hypothetical protein